MHEGRQFNSATNHRMPHGLTSIHQDNEQPTVDFEDGDIGPGHSLSDDPDCDSAESYSYPDFEDEQPTGTSSPNISSTASARFLQLQGQMLRIFESAQSEAAELRQRVNELKDEKLEIVRKGEDAYGTREAGLLARIDELVHETETLSDELVSKDEDGSQDELRRENARLVAKMDVMQNLWTEKLSAISEKRNEDREIFFPPPQ